jgi:hypothetical protein
MKKGIKLPNAAFTIILINTIVTGQGRVMRKGSEDVDGGERRSSGPRKGPLARPGSACRTMPGQLAKEGDPSPVNGRPRRPIRVGTQTFVEEAINLHRHGFIVTRPRLLRSGACSPRTRR